MEIDYESGASHARANHRSNLSDEDIAAAFVKWPLFGAAAHNLREQISRASWLREWKEAKHCSGSWPKLKLICELTAGVSLPRLERGAWTTRFVGHGHEWAMLASDRLCSAETVAPITVV